MRKRSTAVVAAAVLVVSGAAVADAVRNGLSGGDRDAPTVERTSVARTEQAETSGAHELATEGVTGFLYVGVRSQEGCDLRTLSLMTLQVVTALAIPACRFRVSPNAQQLAVGQPCPASSFSMVSLRTREVYRVVRGCAPTWRRSAGFGLTFVDRSGSVVAQDPYCLGVANCLRVVLSSDRLKRELSRVAPRDVRPPFAVREVAWATKRRLGVLVRQQTGMDFVAFFERGRLLRAPELFGRRLAGLKTVPGAAGVTVSGVYGTLRFDGNGRFVQPLGPLDARTFAFSPGRAWFAAARPTGSACVYRSGRPEFPIECMRVDAVELEWG